MTSHLLYKTRCPACAENGRDRSGDNLGVYSDGHSYCYSCGWGSAGSTANKLRTMAHRAAKEIPALPEDITNKLGREAYEWLLRYFPVEDFPRCLYSRSERKLYFMLEGGAYQYRYFGDNKDHPKWVGYGINDNLLHIITPTAINNHYRQSLYLDQYNNYKPPIILVEDLISASKVGHHTPTLCLFGSNISLKRLATLKLLGYNEVIIWLDWDKKEYAVEASRKAQSIGLQARVIHTKLDPKDYTYLEIGKSLYAPP